MTAIQHLLTLDKSQVLRLLGAAIGVVSYEREKKNQ